MTVSELLTYIAYACVFMSGLTFIVAYRELEQTAVDEDEA
jgi:hypothetical protein